LKLLLLKSYFYSYKDPEDGVEKIYQELDTFLTQKLYSIITSDLDHQFLQVFSFFFFSKIFFS